MKNAQGEKETDFIPCSIPPYKAKLAELCSNYLAKGKIAAVDGRIQVRTYNDNNSQKHWVTEVIGEDVRFLSPKDENVGAPAQQPQAQNTPTYQQPTYQQPYQQPYPQQPGQPAYQQQQPGPYSGQYAPPPGYVPPQGTGHPNMPNPNMPPPSSYQGQPPGQLQFGQAQGQPPGQGPARQYGHEVSLDDDIPF